MADAMHPFAASSRIRSQGRHSILHNEPEWTSATEASAGTWTRTHKHMENAYYPLDYGFHRWRHLPSKCGIYYQKNDVGWLLIRLEDDLESGKVKSSSFIEIKKKKKRIEYSSLISDTLIISGARA